MKQIIGDTPRKKEIYIPENPKEHIPRLIETGVIVLNDQTPKTQILKPEVPEVETPILERDESTKPVLHLTHLEKIAVHVPTQKEYWDLMRVYECGGWRWSGEDLPTKVNEWGVNTRETCINLCGSVYSCILR